MKNSLKHLTLDVSDKLTTDYLFKETSGSRHMTPAPTAVQKLKAVRGDVCSICNRQIDLTCDLQYDLHLHCCMLFLAALFCCYVHFVQDTVCTVPHCTARSYWS